MHSANNNALGKCMCQKIGVVNQCMILSRRAPNESAGNMP